MAFCKKNKRFNNNNIFVINEGYRSARSRNNKVFLPKLMKISKILSKNITIVIYDVSRLSRNVKFGLDIMNLISKEKAQIISVNDKIVYKNKNTLNMITNKNKFQNLLSQAEYESDKLSVRSKMNYKFRKQRGDHIGQAPYGFKTIRRACGKISLVKNHDENLIIDHIKNNNKPIKTITKELNRKGIKKRKREWTINMVRNIKQNNSRNNKMNCDDNDDDTSDDEDDNDKDKDKNDMLESDENIYTSDDDYDLIIHN